MCHVFFRFMFTFVLFLHERGWQIRDLEVWGLISYYVSNADKFSYTFIQWGRFLTCITNLHYFQAEMTTAMQVDDLDENGNLISTAMVPIEDVETESTKKQILHAIATSKCYCMPVLHRF